MEPDHKSEQVAISVGSTWITEDILPDILKSLPAKSLCRFRCVCKLWNSLITSSFLVNLHHSVTCSSTTPPHLKPFLQVPYFQVQYNCRYYDSYALYSPPEDTRCLNLNCTSEAGNSSEFLRHDVHFPFRFGEATLLTVTHEEAYLHFKLVGVVRGVVCLSYTLDSSLDYTLLWNPAIHKYLPLPRCTLPSHVETAIADFAHVEHFAGSLRFLCHALGFGYDTSMNDFKVVRVWLPLNDHFRHYCPPLHPLYEVYSTREGLWRVPKIAQITKACIFDLSTSETGCFVNGTIHWIVTKNGFRKDFILMFECEREEFTTVKLPKETRPPADTQKACRIELLEYGGMLCALADSHWDDLIDLWAMEEHGLASSWKKLFRIRSGVYNLIDLYHPSLDKLAPYGPAQWDDYYIRPEFRFEQIMSDRVYEESMFLIDDTRAQSYANDEIVCL